MNEQTPRFKIGDLFTDEQIKKAIKIIKSESRPHARLIDEIVTPNMERINEVTRQENHAGYIAYALEWAITAGGARR